LTRDDLSKLARCQYLPAENESRTYAPSELYLPCADFRMFPFIKMLKWPSEEELSERSESGKFLIKLGMKPYPPLQALLAYISESVQDEAQRLKCLDYVVSKLGPRGIYHDEYARMGVHDRKKYRILPCVRFSPLLAIESKPELQSPVTCFSDQSCGIMGVAIIDQKLGERAKLYSSMFECAAEPDAAQLLHLLKHLVQTAKQNMNGAEGNDKTASIERIATTFECVFKYLSHRSSDFDTSQINALSDEAFIPCLVAEEIKWFTPNQVFFRSNEVSNDKMTEELFQVVPFSPFLAAAGGKSNPDYIIVDIIYTHAMCSCSETGSIYS
jgi:Protein of unknown function (DUF3684)